MDALYSQKHSETQLHAVSVTGVSQPKRWVSLGIWLIQRVWRDFNVFMEYFCAQMPLRVNGMTKFLAVFVVNHLLITRRFRYREINGHHSQT